MPLQLLRAYRKDARGTNRANRDFRRKFHICNAFLFLLCKTEADLTAAGQLDVKLGQQFGVEQRAMLDAVAAVDAVTGAERIQAVLGAGVKLPRYGDGVDHPRHRHFGQSAQPQFVVEEAEVEARIMRDQMRSEEHTFGIPSLMSHTY